jgi:hypothetical protein
MVVCTEWRTPRGRIEVLGALPLGEHERGHHIAQHAHAELVSHSRRVLQALTYARPAQSATGSHPAGSTVPLDHRWPDDLRTRQLRKKAP